MPFGNDLAARRKIQIRIHSVHGVETYFICFSQAERSPAIFSPALTFSLVLSLVSRQEKEHPLSSKMDHPQQMHLGALRFH